MRNRSCSSILGVFFLTIAVSAATVPESPVADAAMRSDIETVQTLMPHKVTE